MESAVFDTAWKRRSKEDLKVADEALAMRCVSLPAAILAA